MGLLAENKRTTKISRDPNNTKWTKNTNSFGQKIMRSQGWEPGQYLGATNAAQADSYTAANASYIRVALKDDMKGLGFNKAKEDQVTGLDVFSDLLSRLNGKTEDDIQEVQTARNVVKANAYVAQKYGLMRFVPGGLLVGDEMKEVKKDEDEKNDVEMEDDDADQTEKKKSKKRKASEASSDEDESEDEAAKKKRRKAEKKAKKAAAAAAAAVDEDVDSSDTVEDEKVAKKQSKKSKKSKDESEDAESSASERKETKEEKKERKRLKKEKKEAKKAAKEAKKNGSASTSGVSTPTGTSTPGSRNFVRSRFIAQKKQAVLDAKALNAIFMVKT